MKGERPVLGSLQLTMVARLRRREEGDAEEEEGGEWGSA